MGNNRLTFFKLVQALLQKKEQLSQLTFLIVTFYPQRSNECVDLH